MKEIYYDDDILPADIFLRDIFASHCTPLSDTESTNPLFSITGTSPRSIPPPPSAEH